MKLRTLAGGQQVDLVDLRADGHGQILVIYLKSPAGGTAPISVRLVDAIESLIENEGMGHVCSAGLEWTRRYWGFSAAPVEKPPSGTGAAGSPALSGKRQARRRGTEPARQRAGRPKRPQRSPR